MYLFYVLGFITFVGWGTGDLFTIFAARKIGATRTTLWVFIFSFLLCLVALPFAPHEWGNITIPLLMLNILLGVLFVSANVLISEAFRISSAPLVGVIVQAFPAVVLVMSALFFGDIVTVWQWGCIAVIFLGVFLCSVDIQKLRQAKTLFDRGTFLAILAMIFCSIFFTFSRVLIEAYGWFLPTFIAVACFPIIFVYMKAKREPVAITGDIQVFGATFLIALLIRAGDFALNWGLAIPGASSIVAPIAGAAPILFVVAARIIFKDPISRQQALGIMTTVCGILFLTRSN